MWIEKLKSEVPFPDPRESGEEGLVAYGGDLLPERLLSAYAQGIFPWYNEDPILWFSPDPRMVLRPEDLVVNRTLGKNLKRRRYEVRLDTAFEQVIRACAEAPRPDQDGTWINPDMIRAYCKLHELGFAHSCEAWCDGELVGGIYGVSLGGAFFGESMFARASDASKVALVQLTRQIHAWGFDFLDCQVHTDHLERLGGRMISRDDFLKTLSQTLKKPTRQGVWVMELEP